MIDEKLINELKEYIKTQHKECILTKQNYYEPFTIDTQSFLDHGMLWDDITEVMCEMNPMYEDYTFHNNENIRTIIVV